MSHHAAHALLMISGRLAQMASGKHYSFTGLKGSDVDGVKAAIKAMGKVAREGALAVGGQNWGELDMNGTQLAFRQAPTHKI